VADYVLGCACLSSCLYVIKICEQDIAKNYFVAIHKIYIADAPYTLPWKWLILVQITFKMAENE